MNKDQFTAIKESIDIIDEKIKDNLVLDQLSREVGVSKFHLHRLFKSLTGRSLIRYVRERKLSLSALDLLNTDLKIIDIANEYQYGEEQSYIRAFKQMYQMTPAQYRRTRCELPMEQKIDLSLYNLPGDGLIVEPRMCIKPQFYLQGIETEIVHSINLEENLTNRLAKDWKKNYVPKVPNRVNEDVYIGYIRNKEHMEYSAYYATCVEIDHLSAVEPPMKQYSVKTLQYAVFRYVGFHSPYDITFATIKYLYDYITRWMIESEFHEAGEFHFEKIDLKVCTNSYCEMDIYYPIEPKQI